MEGWWEKELYPELTSSIGEKFLGCNYEEGHSIPTTNERFDPNPFDDDLPPCMVNETSTLCDPNKRRLTPEQLGKFVDGELILDPGAPGEFLRGGGVGAALCQGILFRSTSMRIEKPAAWQGKGIIVRPNWMGDLDVNNCVGWGTKCNGVPWSEGMGINIWFSAATIYPPYRFMYNFQWDLKPHEMADFVKFRGGVGGVKEGEEVIYNYRFLQWEVMDPYKRPMYHLGYQNGNIPANYFYNISQCSRVGCGQIEERPHYRCGAPDGLKWIQAGATAHTVAWELDNPALAEALESDKTVFTQAEWTAFGIDKVNKGDYVKVGDASSGFRYFVPATTPLTETEWRTGSCLYDAKGVFIRGNGVPGYVPIPSNEIPRPKPRYHDKVLRISDIHTFRYSNANSHWAFKQDADGYGGIMSLSFKPASGGGSYQVQVCPDEGCWPVPTRPPPDPKELEWSVWSSPSTWEGTPDHMANPMNHIDITENDWSEFDFKLANVQDWADSIPSEDDNVWIPPWKKVLLDTSTPRLGRVIIEGMLIINGTANVNLDAVYLEIKGGSLIIATMDESGEEVLGPFLGSTKITLHGTNNKLAWRHGDNPRENPQLIIGKEGRILKPAAVFNAGTLIAKGRQSSHNWVGLSETASKGSMSILLDGNLGDWAVDSEIVITSTSFQVHEAEVRRIQSLSVEDGDEYFPYRTRITLDVALDHEHYADTNEQIYGTKRMRMQARVGLLTRNIVFQGGTGQGEHISYTEWNGQKHGNCSAAVCGNGVCEHCEISPGNATKWETLHWERTGLYVERSPGKSRPRLGRELNNPFLAQALEGKDSMKFTTEEWDNFGILDLQNDDYIESKDGFFFKPQVSIFPHTPCGDCRGPAWEFGVSIVATEYLEEYIYCTPETTPEKHDCKAGVKARYKPSTELDSVELRYFGKNNLQAGISLEGLGSESAARTSITNVSMNRGYHYGIQAFSEWGKWETPLKIQDNVIFRSMLPAIEVGGSGLVVERNLVVTGIEWRTHRGAKVAGKAFGMLTAMMGMFHQSYGKNIFRYNVAAGSERSGFTLGGTACSRDGMNMFVGNEAFSALAGYWMVTVTDGSCSAINDFQGWKLYHYGIFADVGGVKNIMVINSRFADVQVGIGMYIRGTDNPLTAWEERKKFSQQNEKASTVAALNRGAHPSPKKVFIEGSLFVARSQNDQTRKGRPGLHTCSAPMCAWCGHVGGGRVAIWLTPFTAAGNAAPNKPFTDPGDGLTIYGLTEVEGCTFADYRGRDIVFKNVVQPASSATTFVVRESEKVRVDESSKLSIQMVGGACVDLSCDGFRHILFDDEDGTYFDSKKPLSRVVAFAPAENISGSYGLPYRDGVNFPINPSTGERLDPQPDWWYPNAPILMRSDRDGYPVNLHESYLKHGYGIHRKGCSWRQDWGAHRCDETDTSTHYRRFTIESMDRDRMLRRISPVALSSSSGYTDLMAGGPPSGWCFGYSCQKCLMSFPSIVAMGETYTMHTTGSMPQRIRFTLPHANEDDRIILKVFYTTPCRLQVFVGLKYIQDVNMYDGKYKRMLTKQGSWASNVGVPGTYVEQELSTDPNCACKLEGNDECIASVLCTDGGTASNAHGSNTYKKSTGEIEILVAGHEPRDFIEIRIMPVVQVSLVLSCRVEEFFEQKDNLIESTAFVLGIPPDRIFFVDVVPGNARRSSRSVATRGKRIVAQRNEGSRRLLSADLTNVDLEITPVSEIALPSDSLLVDEDVGFATLTILRNVNMQLSCSVMLETVAEEYDTGVSGMHFQAMTHLVEFAPQEASKDVQLEIIREMGYRSEARTFSVRLSDPQNASLSDTGLTVYINNVDAPPPASPVLSGAVVSSFSLSITWTVSAWPNTSTFSPSPEMQDVLQWEVEMGEIDGSSEEVTAWMNASDHLDEETSTSVLIPDLEVHTLYQFRVRYRTEKGWTEYSEPSSAIRTLAVKTPFAPIGTCFHMSDMH